MILDRRVKGNHQQLYRIFEYHVGIIDAHQDLSAGLGFTRLEARWSSKASMKLPFGQIKQVRGSPASTCPLSIIFASKAELAVCLLATLFWMTSRNVSLII